ncbi:MFS general substrate transporter [Lindgomyces ingoldianus]|uniref:MFS general substrate transporter n=1 Tax=Lindgomyces ingoldianus TaxID=673940 RepID=A0ACB6QKT9_9PLEO|nr:MFS general substrate transporter [Lindgomyces ingoldianus]KAF2467536.1 MFS general substrate transporter [Lindgomyces ingoldianus]
MNPSEQQRTSVPSDLEKEKELDMPNVSSRASSQSRIDGRTPESHRPLATKEAQELAGETPAGFEASGEQKPHRSKLKIALIMLSLGISVLLVAIDITIVTTALPTISEHFHSAAGYTWIGSAYLIANAAATPIWGKVSDIFGRKPILLVTNVIFFIGSLLAAVSVNINMLITARVVQGIGGGGLIVLVNIAISDLFAMRERGAYFGIIGGVWALASSLGPVVGGAFTQNVSWRWCFYINLPLDGLAFFIILFILDLHTPKTPLRKGLKAVDWLGAFTMVVGTTMLLLGLEFGGVSFPWKSATVICLIVFGVITIGFFFVVEYRLAPYPLMPLDLFSKRSNLAALGVCFFHAFVFISGSYFLPLYFQAVLGATPILSGVYLLPTALSLSFLSAFTGIFIRKTGQYLPPIWAGMTFMTIGFGLFINLGPSSPWAKIILYQIVAGVGVGPNFQSPLIALQSLVPKRDIATATATFGFIRNLGSAISIVVGSVVFQNQMISKQAMLRASLGPQTASAFGGGSAGANVRIIASLPDSQKAVARKAFADSLSTMWILYVVFAAVGLGVSFLITKNVLQKQHEETKTGLEEEKKKKLEREQEKAEKRRSKLASRGELTIDTEAGTADAAKEKDVRV